jgi:prepilin-type N-terminal cleavage/methylation domain-containing protein
MIRERARDERGFTLVEMLATIVIMGLVVAPLTAALMEAINLIPAAGDRTKLATDTVLVEKQFSDDVADAQFFWNIPASAVPFQEPATGAWTLANSTSPTQSCGAAANVFAFYAAWTDTGAGATDTRAKAALWAWGVTGSGTTQQVVLTRTFWPDTSSGHTNDPAVTMLTGYCKSGDNFFSVNTTAPTANQSYEDVQFTFSLRNSLGQPLPKVTLDARIRAEHPGP